MSLVSNLKHVGCIVGGCNAAGYLLTAAFETHKLTDLVGTGSFVVASASLAHRNGIFSPFKSMSVSRQLVVNVAIMIWGSRLAAYLFARVLKLGEDKRLDKFYRKPGEPYFDTKRSNYPIKLSSFWTIQSLWGFLLLLPVTFLNSVPTTNSALNLFTRHSTPMMRVLTWLPVVTLYGGLLLEAVADYQKSRYRDDKRNDGHWCDVGLFSLSRHPNYFAELLVWWSVYFCCIPALTLPLSAVAVISPLFSSFIILKLSGVPLLEKKNLKQYGDNKGYQAYVQNTYQLVPFPKSFSSGNGNGGGGGVDKKK